VRQLGLRAITTSELCCGPVWRISGSGEEEMGVQIVRRRG